jgi:tRNA pseudouridine55 synthase
MQYPPAHSAKFVGGERAYHKARRGEQVEMKANQVEVTEFEIKNIRIPEVDFKVVCSKGTYIRSLAHDLGKELGIGGYLSSLCRTRIGNFKLEDAYELPFFVEEMKKLRNSQSLKS